MMNTRKTNILLTKEDIYKKFEDQATVTGQIVFADPIAEIFKIRIGKNDDETFIEGILPFSEFSVQNLRLLTPDPNNIHKNILGKDAFFAAGQWIKCDIISISNDIIYLSRRSRQIIPFHNLQIGDEVNCTVTALKHPLTFVEIEHDFLALNCIKDLSNTKYSNIEKWIKVGDQFKAIITEITPDKRIFVSRKAFFDKYYSNIIRTGQMVMGTVGQKVDGGYFVELTPSIAGIMDVDENQTFYEGQNVLCIVNRKNRLPNGNMAYHLEFCNYLK